MKHLIWQPYNGDFWVIRQFPLQPRPLAFDGLSSTPHVAHEEHERGAIGALEACILSVHVVPD